MVFLSSNGFTALSFSVCYTHAFLFQSNVAKLYSERLTQMIQFGWQEPDKRKHGVITLEGLRLATSFVSLMRPVPLRFGNFILFVLIIQ